MSYEPTLVISKKDLDKHDSLLIDGAWQYQNTEKEPKGEDGLTVMEYIRDIYKNRTPVKISGVELIICNPSLTRFNRSVREKLTELNVEFEESN